MNVVKKGYCQMNVVKKAVHEIRSVKCMASSNQTLMK